MKMHLCNWSRTVTVVFLVVCGSLLVINIVMIADYILGSWKRGYISGERNKLTVSYDSSIIINKQKARVLGQLRPERGFLTIGIPTVARKQTSYLQQTLDSLIKAITSEQWDNVTVVILLADTDNKLKSHLKKLLRSSYFYYIQHGFIIVIEAPFSFYPSFHDLDMTFHDTKDRMRWRAKQVLDYAFLSLYCHDLSDYYLQLEDDMITSPDFLQDIREFVAMQHQRWISLEFSRLGFIGKLYHTKDLPKLAQFFMTFYAEQPVDYLYQYFNILMAQPKPITRVPSLFQHIGVQSSLQGKTQKLKDVDFVDSLKQLNGDNPPAVIDTTIPTFQAFHAELAYSTRPGYFWGVSPTSGSVYTIMFKKYHLINRVAITTGTVTKKQDYLRNGRLEAIIKCAQTRKDKQVGVDYVYIDAFHKGQLDVKDFGNRVPFEVCGLRIMVTQDQQEWLLIGEIAVFTASH